MLAGYCSPGTSGRHQLGEYWLTKAFLTKWLSKLNSHMFSLEVQCIFVQNTSFSIEHTMELYKSSHKRLAFN